jgi:taurine transport system ATP-binding protein
MQGLALDNISIRYDRQKEAAVSDASLEVAAGDFVVLVGRSGCGKTSLLNVAAGLVEPEHGSATVNGNPITGPGPDRAVVFQNDALFPWLTARENVALSLRLRGVAPRERAGRADALLAEVKLGDAGDKRIWELSGGMRQRVGLARALAAEPQFLLLDEPLGALDALTRERMQSTLLDLWSSSKVGVLMVTHGIEEALILATKILVLAPNPGRIVRRFETNFGRRYAASETIRDIKADPDFASARSELADAIFEGEAA